MTVELFRAAWEASLSAAVMILAVLALRLKFQDRTPRRVFCLLWDIVLVRLLVLGTLPSPVSIQRWLPDFQVGTQTAICSYPDFVTAVPGTGAVMQEAWQEQTAYLTGDTLYLFTAETAAATSNTIDWTTVLTALWLGVALLMAGGFLWSHLRSRKLYAASLPCKDGFVLDWLTAHPLYRPVQARISDQIAAPLTYGVLYPVVLLPRKMDWEDKIALSCVLAHEHEHIRRFDALRKPLLAAALCLHWFNPLAWVMYTLANRDIELACDEAVLRGGADRERYALALLSMEERRGQWSPSGSHFSGHALEERIRAIMKRKHISITALVAVLVVMSVTTTVFASAAPEKNNNSQTQNPPEVTTRIYDHLKLVEDDGVTIMSKGGENGEKLYSVDDGKTWMSEDRYHAEYGGWGDDWQVEWWTYEDYKAWLEDEKIALQSIIGDRGYNSTMGWFTWDQQRVDEAIAMYEGILEEIKNGALYSKTIVDKSGNELEDVMLGSEGLFITSTFEAAADDDFVTVPKSEDKAALIDELKAFGVEGNEDLLTYKGHLIRTLVDGVSVGDNGYAINYVYRNDQGTVVLNTLRAVIHNPDGSYNPMGDLIGIAIQGMQGFDQGLIDCGTFNAGLQATTIDGYNDYDNMNSPQTVESTQTAIAASGTTEPGKSFEEIFAQYEVFGLVYRPRETGMGALTFNGVPVRSFADLKPDGSAFTYEDPAAEYGLKIFTEYNQDSKLTGLRYESAPINNIDQTKRELSFDYCTPVQGKLSAGFGQGNLRFHYGVDIAAEKGTDITAFADGTVTEIGFSAEKGHYVVLTHADSYSTLYAHCLSVAVSEGDSVVMGQKIAEVGASGMATGSVLHFELRNGFGRGETYLDPAVYLEMTV